VLAGRLIKIRKNTIHAFWGMGAKRAAVLPCRATAAILKGVAAQLPKRHIHPTIPALMTARPPLSIPRHFQLQVWRLIAGFFLLALHSSTWAESPISSRSHVNWDDGWRFILADPAGAQEIAFDDTAWERVLLPHDWAIRGPISQSNPGIGRMGYYPGGIGWYRKTFVLPSSFAGKHVRVTFDGVYMNADVWINGHSLGRRPYGYVSFSHDLTPYLRNDGQPEVLAVRVDNSVQPSSRWYTGCGIYRHVWLTATNDTHVEPDGIFVTTPEATSIQASIRVQTSIFHQSHISADVSVEHVVRRNGKTVGAFSPATKSIGPEGKESYDQTVTLASPDLWSPESPALYLLETIVRAGGRIVDRTETHFGIRRLEFTAEQGFFLNGRNFKLKGVCLHHDAGPVGAAVPEDVLRRRLRLLQEAGCNAIRTGHAPMASEFYDLCDEMGILVMGETLDEWRIAKKDMANGGYNRLFADWAVRDVQDAIRRDRNHPCIFMWSVGNEVRELGNQKASPMPVACATPRTPSIPPGP
jgi:beta-galactosidase